MTTCQSVSPRNLGLVRCAQDDDHDGRHGATNGAGDYVSWTGENSAPERAHCGEHVDGLTCPCGNATHLAGFEPVVDGERVTEPASADFASPVYECVECGRRFDLSTHADGTVAIVRGPTA
jgi:hypothetical protein